MRYKKTEKSFRKIKIINLDENMFNDHDEFVEKFILQNTSTHKNLERKISIVKRCKGRNGRHIC